MGTSTSTHPLLGGDGDETKFDTRCSWYGDRDAFFSLGM